MLAWAKAHPQHHGTRTDYNATDYNMNESAVVPGGQDRPVGGGLRDLTHLREIGDSLLQAEPLGLIPVFNRQHGHQNPSQRTQAPRTRLLPSRPSKIERGTR